MQNTLTSLPEVNSDGFRYFKRSEFDCAHTGRNQISDAFVRRLDELRHRCGFPFNVTSGYRDRRHPAESAKSAPGQHSRGIAVDIRVNNALERRILLDNAVKMCFNGIGIAKTFIHVDDRDSDEPVAWTY